jgi:hypothetical protein
MAWQPFSFHFRQRFDGGYRYLDRTGDFMVAAETEYDLVPGDIQVTGAKLEKPEDSVFIAVDSTEIRVRQDFPGDRGETFLETTLVIVELVRKFFEPLGIRSNGFASHLYWPLPTPEKALAASVNIGGKFPIELGEMLGMVPTENDINCVFQSGSKELRVHIHPVSVQTTSIQWLVPGLRDSKKQRDRIARMNRKAERLPGDLQQGLMLTLDLQQKEPPPDDLEEHFAELLAHEEKVADIITVK